MTPIRMTARDRRRIHKFVRRAVAGEAPLLATALDRYATGEGLSWEEIALSLGGTPDGLNQVALCRPPRSERFLEDVTAIANGFVNPDRLLSVLRRIQVLQALTGLPQGRAQPRDAAAATHGMLLAARDREGDEATAGDAAPPDEHGEGPTVSGEPAPRQEEKPDV